MAPCSETRWSVGCRQHQQRGARESDFEGIRVDSPALPQLDGLSSDLRSPCVGGGEILHREFPTRDDVGSCGDCPRGEVAEAPVSFPALNSQLATAACTALWKGLWIANGTLFKEFWLCSSYS